MPAAAALRLQIEHALASRFPSALTPGPCTIREVAPTGIEEADRLLDGGLPVGAISEITGPASSGRTSLALSFLARRTAEARVCAWVDTNDAFDPESAAANGVDLRQLLWVRCQDRPQSSLVLLALRDRKRGNHGRSWIRHCAPPIFCSRPLASRPLCSIWAIPRRSTAIEFRLRHGSVFDRLLIAPAAASLFSDRLPMPSPAPRSLSSALHSKPKRQAALCCAALRSGCSVDDSALRRYRQVLASHRHPHGPPTARGIRRSAHESECSLRLCACGGVSGAGLAAAAPGLAQ